MNGMSFLSFLLLSGIGVMVAVVLHYLFHYRLLEGLNAVFAKTAMPNVFARKALKRAMGGRTATEKSITPAVPKAECAGVMVD